MVGYASLYIVHPVIEDLKRKFPSVTATQVTLDKEVDLMTKDGIRISSAHLFLTDLV
ncbi:MAG: hypothetical protein WB792_05575 [Desulfobacterales bacterium]